MFASDDAKVLSFALGDAKVPNASSFALQWNIGFKPCRRSVDREISSLFDDHNG